MCFMNNNDDHYNGNSFNALKLLCVAFEWLWILNDDLWAEALEFVVERE